MLGPCLLKCVALIEYKHNLDKPVRNNVVTIIRTDNPRWTMLNSESESFFPIKYQVFVVTCAVRFSRLTQWLANNNLTTGSIDTATIDDD